MNIKHLIFLQVLFSTIWACVPSSRLKTANQQIQTLQSGNKRSHELDSLLKVEQNKNIQLTTQLDKTERVLAAIYTQFSGNIPKKVSGAESEGIKAEIVQQNVELHNTIKELNGKIDSLLETKNKITPPELNITPVKGDKKNSESAKTIETLKRYIQTLEANYNSEFEKNKQLNKSLNSYSLKLEIMDNERIKEIQDIQKSMSVQMLELDSLRKLTSTQTGIIAKLESKANKLKDSELKEPNKSKNDLREIDNLNTKIAELQKKLNKAQVTIDSSFQIIENLTSEKIDSKSQLKSSQDSTITQKIEIKELQIKIDSLIRLNKNIVSQNLNDDIKKRLESNVGELQKNNNQLNEEIASLKNKNEILLLRMQELEQLKDKNGKKEKSLVDSIKINQLMAQNSDLSKDISKLNEKISILESEISTNSDEKKSLNTQINLLNESVNDKNKQILALSKKASKSEPNKKIEILQDSLIRKENKIVDLMDQIGQHKNLYEQQIKNYEKEIQQREDKIKILENIKSSAPAENNLNDSNIKVLSNKSDGKSLNEEEINTRENQKISNAHNEAKKKTSSQKNYDPLISKLESILKPYHMACASISKNEKGILIIIPQKEIYLDNTLALNDQGATLISKINAALIPWKIKHIEILGNLTLIGNTPEFAQNRAQTIGKLMIALGSNASTINYSTKAFQADLGSEKCTESIELQLGIN